MMNFAGRMAGGFCIKNDEFALQMMNFALKMMGFVLKGWILQQMFAAALHGKHVSTDTRGFHHF